MLKVKSVHAGKTYSTATVTLLLKKRQLAVVLIHEPASDSCFCCHASLATFHVPEQQSLLFAVSEAELRSQLER